MGCQLPLPKRGRAPNFLPMSIVPMQMAAWIKMPLGVEVGLDTSDIVLDGNPAPPQQKRGGKAPNFRPMCILRPNGCVDQDATWYGGRPRLRPHCARWGPSSPPPKKEQEGQHPLTGQRAPPNSGGTYRRRRTLIDGYLESPFPTACLLKIKMELSGVACEHHLTSRDTHLLCAG